MKPEKMTDEELSQALTAVGSELPKGQRRVHAGAVAAHIAALSAEVKLATENYDGACARAQQMEAQRNLADREAHALRERVQELEAMGQRVCEALGLRWQPPDAALWTRLEEATTAESRLAAIRQRAGKFERLGQEAQSGHYGYSVDERFQKSAKSVARYLLGEDATGAVSSVNIRATVGTTPVNYEPSAAPVPEFGGLEDGPPQCSAHPGRKCDPETPGVFECAVHETKRGGVVKVTPIIPESPEQAATGASQTCHADGGQCDTSCPDLAEPTTAKAFATVRHGGILGYGVLCPASETALSLLERRMGAMGRALRLMRESVRADLEGGPIPRALRAACVEADASLTDAPPVFTLEEVEKALVSTGIGPVAREQMQGCLSALRKVTP